MAKHRVVIVGGGFGGLNAALGLAHVDVSVTLVDRRNFHLFQPLLYQVATGGLSPADIASPLRAVLKRQRNTRVLHGDVTDIDPRSKRITLESCELEYDTLILGTGVRPYYFGHDDWEAHAPGLKTVEDATRIRAKILNAFERAECEDDAAARRAWMTFVIVGGGPTGVELAGAVGELARHTLRHDFRRIRSGDARVLLVEGSNTLLGSFVKPLPAAARRALEKLGVEVVCDTQVNRIGERSVTLRDTGSGEDTILGTRTILWAAGVRASNLGGVLARAAGVETDRLGRLRVEPDLTVPGHADLFVIGDLAHLEGADGNPLPGVAPVAMQQGRYVARAIRSRAAGRPVAPFRYRNKGSLAVIGRAAAVADLGKHLRFTGYPAWCLWLLVHIMYLAEFENRVLVFIHWAFSYFTRKRGARLITGQREI